MNKKSFALSSLAAASILFMALASCGTVVNSSSNQTSSNTASSQSGSGSNTASASTDDKKVAAIRVKTGTLASSFQQNYSVIDSIIFENLVIETLNAGGTKLGEIAYADEPAAFSHNTILTAALTDSASYLLTYKGTAGTFQVSVPYKVIYAVPGS
jgi:hypothetical protein